MTKKLNSAARILDILQRASNYSAEHRTVEVWAKLFDIQELDTTKKNFAVSYPSYRKSD